LPQFVSELHGKRKAQFIVGSGIKQIVIAHHSIKGGGCEQTRTLLIRRVSTTKMEIIKNVYK
jgi:hypothetical protein